MQNDTEHQVREAHRETARRPAAGTGRLAMTAIAVIALVAAGLFAWNRWMTPVGYELVVGPGTLFTGASDTARIRASAINKAGGAIPFLHFTLRGEILDGRSLGRLEAGEGELLFISEGTQEGLVRLRVMLDDWPFPLLAEIRIVAPVAMSFLPPHPDTRSNT